MSHDRRGVKMASWIAPSGTMEANNRMSSSSTMGIVATESVWSILLMEQCVNCRAKEAARASTELFPWEGATSTIRLSFLGCWWCNANGHSQNALPLLHHKENIPCHGNSKKMRFVWSKSNIVYYDYLRTIRYLQMFRTGYFFSKKHRHQS